jgi:nucleoside phosphorylase
MTPTLIGLSAAAIRRNGRWRRESNVQFKERVARVTTKSRVLIMVASALENRAMLAAVAAVNGVTPRPWYGGPHTVFRLGTVSAAEVLVTHCGQGSLGPGASTLTAQSVLDQVRPDYLILAGIGYGLMPDEQHLGDVMVSTQMRVMDHKEVIDVPVPGGLPAEFQRGPRPDASVTLVDRARTAEVLGWHGPTVHFGPMLAMNVRVSSQILHRRLRESDPDAIGGEMEGSGIYAAGAKGKVDWIVIKGISDWGNRDGNARKAARSAARFVVHMIESSGLNAPPSG